jgi:ribosomal protein L37E
MNSLAYGYASHLERHQHPKPEEGRGGKANLETKSLTDTTSSKYDWNQSLRNYSGVPDSGKWDQKTAWRCPDCGLEVQDVTEDCCSRCGSPEPAVFR